PLVPLPALRPLYLLAPMALVALGCSRSGEDLNVLILTLDTTRADRFGAYGLAAARTPNFDRFSAERAVRFDRAITAAPITFPSHSSIMTGTYPVFHGVHDNDYYRLDDNVTTLAEILGEEGFSTAAFLAAYPLDSQVNLSQGFDFYDDDFQQDWTPAEIRRETPLAFGFLERKSDRVNLAVERWLERHGDERFFLWVHYFDPHQPYDAAPPYDSQFFDSPYDGEMAFMDESFGALVALLEERDLLERTLVVIVGDHGEALRQHGEPTHASYIYDATMNVPLWVASPTVGRPGTSVPAMVRTIDVAPTVLDLLGLGPTEEMQGRSLRPLLEEPTTRWGEPALIESYYSQFQFGWAPLRGLIADGWKYIEGPAPELYDLGSDPDEVTNLLSRHPEKAAELAERLHRLWRRMSADDPGRSTVATRDEETKQKLAALGYLGGVGSASSRARRFPAPDELAAMPNPMAQALALSYINFSFELLRTLRFEEALSVARSGLQIDPGNSRLQLSVGRAAAAMGLYDLAEEAIQAARALDPDSPEGPELLGRIHLKRGDPRAAVNALSESLRLGAARRETLALAATAFAAEGQIETAIRHYEAALELDPDTWHVRLNLATLLVQEERWEEARSELQKALDLRPYSPQVRFAVAQFYGLLGNLEFSRQQCEEVLVLAPRHLGARVLLAEILVQQGEEIERAETLLQEVIDAAPTSASGQRAAELREQWSASEGS
ncbi:MAG: sulfatase-like hydrolase/transferase, partial [Acidobacteria bacterium]|nr:sulfatase-like hydrolase/transferase [Acidobacteriota bacterium]